MFAQLANIGALTAQTILANGSTTLQNFTGLQSTTTNATSTNLFATNASSTNLFAQSATIGTFLAQTILANGSTTLQNFTGLQSTTTNSTSTSFYASSNITGLGSFYLGTSTGWSKFTLQGAYGSTLTLLDIASTTNSNGSATTSLFKVNANGNVGIGSSTPWAQLSIMGTTSGNTYPLLAIATSTGSATALPLFIVTATTTGALDYARVGIGTTSPWGNAGLRDQLTVAGRIYSTWQYLSCDAGGSSLTGTIGTFANAVVNGGCGDFVIDNDGANNGYTLQNNYPAALRLIAGNTTAALNNVISVRTDHFIAVASSSPTIEARFKAPNQASANGVASTTMYLVGFSDRVNTANNGGTLPTNMIGFVATNTPNWKAVISKAGTLTIVDTGIATTTTSSNFSRFRVEISSSTSSFLVNGTVVATIAATDQVNVPMAPMISVGKTVAAAIGVSEIDLSSLRVWVDDPAGVSSSSGLTPITAIADAPYQSKRFEKNGGTGMWYYASSVPPTEHQIVGFSFGTSSGVVEAADGSQALIGVVSSHGNIIGENTGSSPIVTSGRLDILIAQSNGPINAGDAIAVSTTTRGIGVRAIRAGHIIGYAVEAFDPINSIGSCAAEVSDNNATSTCLGLVTIQLAQGWSEGSTTLFSDIGETVTDMTQAVTDLASDVFTKGAQFTKLAIGKVVAQTAVVKDFFAVVFNILPGGSINVPSGTNQIAGSDTLPVGATTYFVANTNVTAGAKIFITPRTMLATPIAVTQVTPGQGFTVTLAGQAPTDIPFDWFMLSTYSASGAQAAAVVQSSGGGAPAPTTPTPTPVESGTGSTTPDTASSTPPVDTSSSTPPSDTGTTTLPVDTGSSTPTTP